MRIIKQTVEGKLKQNDLNKSSMTQDRIFSVVPVNWPPQLLSKAPSCLLFDTQNAECYMFDQGNAVVTNSLKLSIIHASGILSTYDAYLSGTFNITSLDTNDNLIHSSSNHYQGNHNYDKLYNWKNDGMREKEIFKIASQCFLITWYL